MNKALALASLAFIVGCGSPKQASISPTVPPASTEAIPTFTVTVPSTSTSTGSDSSLVVPITLTSTDGWTGDIAFGQQSAVMSTPTGDVSLPVSLSTNNVRLIPNAVQTVKATVSYQSYPAGTYNFSLAVGIVGQSTPQWVYGKVVISTF